MNDPLRTLRKALEQITIGNSDAAEHLLDSVIPDIAKERDELLECCRIALTGLNDRLRFPIELTDSYKLATRIETVLKGNARLLPAANNVFDSAAAKLSINAAGMAERLQECGIAELILCLTDMLSRFRACIAQGNGEIEGDKEAIVRTETILAKVKGATA